MSLNAYQKTQASAESASETEYRLFGQVTGALFEAKEKAYTGGQLMKALDWNRRLWSTLSTDCALPGNGLPNDLRAGIISLSIFVSKHTGLVMRGKADIDDLININRTIMEGLAMQQAKAREAASAEAPPADGEPPLPEGGVTVG